VTAVALFDPPWVADDREDQSSPPQFRLWALAFANTEPVA